MRRVIFFIALAVIIAAAFSIGCEEQQVEFDSEYIRNVAMTASIDKSYKPQKITYTFDKDTQRIYCTFQLVNVDTGTSIAAEWIYLKGEANVENYLIDSWTQFIEGNQNMAMYIDNHYPNGWPSGSYVLALYVNGELQGSVPFRVKY